MMRLGLCLLGVLAASTYSAPASAASGLHRIGPFPGELRSDSTRFLSAVDGKGDVVAFDVTTRRMRTVPVQPGCQATGMGPGRLVFSCSHPDPSQLAAGSTLDLLTGRVASLPSVNRASFRDADGAYYEASGSEWARVRVFGYHVSRPAFVRLSTGEISSGPGSDRRRRADLDREGLTRKNCSPVLRPQVPDDQAPGDVPGELAVNGNRAASVTYASSGALDSGRVMLYGCGARERIVRRCVRVRCADVALSARQLVWVESPPTPVRSRIQVMDLRTGRTRSIGVKGSVQLRRAQDRFFASHAGGLSEVRLGD